jgi:hypothetical protein
MKTIPALRAVRRTRRSRTEIRSLDAAPRRRSSARFDDPVGRKVRLARRRRPDRHGFVGELDVARAAVGFRVDRDRPDAHPVRALHHAARNLAAVGDQDFLEHRYKGMLPCLRQGFSTFLLRSIASERQIRPRVSCGMITSSM